MTYEGIIYFAGPRSRWAGKVDSQEIIARFPARWRWAVLALTLQTFARLDQRRCGYVILRDGEPIEHYDPPAE